MGEANIRRGLPMPPENHAPQITQVQPAHQLAYFCGKQVAITHGKDAWVTRGKMLNFTDLGIMMLLLTGTHKLVWMGTIYSIEESAVDQSMLSS